jgi:hypothetical protein
VKSLFIISDPAINIPNFESRPLLRASAFHRHGACYKGLLLYDNASDQWPQEEGTAALSAVDQF